MTELPPLPEKTRRAARDAREHALADAKQRSLRTLAQGLAIDVVAAIGGGALAAIGTLDDSAFLTGTGWTIIATSVAKSGLTAVASYLARLSTPPS